MKNLKAIGALLAGSLLQPLLAAEVRTFSVNNEAFVVEDVSAEVQVYFRALRFNEATEQWNVDLVLTNSGPRGLLAPVFISIESFSNTTGPLPPDGIAGNPPKPFYMLDRTFYSRGAVALPSGEASLPRSIVLGFVEGAGAPTLRMKVFASPAGPPIALGLTRTLNGAGQPLPNVKVFERGPQGDRELQTDPEYGVVTLGQDSGEYLWRFEHEGHLPVWRQTTLLRGAVQFVPNPRLAERSGQSNSVPIGVASTVTDLTGDVELNITASSFPETSVITITAVDGQTLPAPLPAGWSPVNAFWFEGSVPPTQPVSGRVRASTPPAALAHWNSGTARWNMLQVFSAAEANPVQVTLPGFGAYALVVGDPAPLAPPTLAPDTDLLPAELPPQPTIEFAATGVVTPTSSPASRVPEAVTGTASVTISNRTGALLSGQTLRTEVTETYRLQDGSERFTALYDTFITGYRDAAGALASSFPMRPRLLFGGEELAEAKVRVDVLSPETFKGAIFQTNGGTIVDGPIRIIAQADDVSSPQAVSLRRLTSTNFASLLTGGQRLAAAFDLTVAGVASNRALTLQMSNAANRHFILARVLSDVHVNGLEPIERFQTETNGNLRSMEPADGTRLPGMRKAGQYLLVQVPGPHALVTGLVSNGVAGLVVRAGGLPWTTFSGADGGYRLIAPTGAVQVSVTDLTSGDADFADINITDANSVVNLNFQTAPRGPRVISVNPPAGARNVSRVMPITITFSEAVNPGTVVQQGIRVFQTNGQPISASLTLNLRNTIATLLPTDPLPAGQLFTLVLSNTIADLSGLTLEGATQFTFETQRDQARTNIAKLTIFAPGATNIPPDILANIPGYEPGEDRTAIVVHGAQGATEPDRPVALVNESTGETSTTLSKADGSFFGLIRGTEEDFVSATIVNANGTRTYLPVSKQLFDNGFVGLFQGGGILEAERDGSGVEVQVQPGSIESRSKFKIDFLNADMIDQLNKGVPPQHAKLLGKGANLIKEGGPVEGALDVSFSIDPAEVELFPGMQRPEDGVFAMCAITEVNGEIAYLFLDGMAFENGKLVSSSPPDIQLAIDEIATAWEANAENMASRSGAGFIILATGQTLVEVAAHIPDPAASLVQFAVVAIQMQMSRKVRVTGEVIACDVQSTLPCDPRIRPGLPGAVVSIRHASVALSGGLKGGLDKGAMYCLSDKKGKYSILIDNPSLINFTGNIDDDVGLAIATATHPRFFGQRPAEPVLMTGTSPFATADLAFVFNSHSGQNGSPPFLSPAHSPANPQPEQEVELRILASHGSGPPTVIDPVVDQVISLVPGVTVTPGDVTIDPGTSQSGSTSIEKTFRVRTDFAARVILVLEAGSANGRTRRMRYAITFGGADANVPDPLASPDPADKTGPHVVRTLPSEQQQAFPLGFPIQIVFSEPVQRDIETDDSIQVSPSPGQFTRKLSGDQRTLTIHTFQLRPAQEYTITVANSVEDLANNGLDQRPNTSVLDPHVFTFKTAAAIGASLPGINMGGGVVIRGIYAYALDRGEGQQNAIVTFDLSNPAAPIVKSRVNFFGRPRDLALIPNYSFKQHPSASIRTEDLLAVVGGDIAPIFDNDANISFSGQVLRVYTLANPVTPALVASKLISLSSVAAATKIEWEPPLLAYLESSADVQQIGLVNLQAFIIGAHLTQQEFLELPHDITPGVDLNKDGDFVDSGDELPLPANSPVVFAGKVNAIVLEDTTQRIIDFDLNTRVGHLSVTLNDGNEINVNGAVTSTPLKPAYRILLDTGSPVPRQNRAQASFEFPNAWPKRLLNVFGVRLVDTNGTRVVNLAFVSVHAGSGSKVAVLNITDGLNLKLETEIQIDPALGLAQSATIGEDGFLHLSTSNNRLLIDPARVNLVATDPLKHPAIVGMIPGAGSGNFTTAASLAGLNAVNLGEQSRVVQTSPFLRFGSLADYPELLDPETIIDNRAAIEEMRRKFTPVSTLFPARFRAAGPDVPSTLDPAMPAAHYYVLVVAPGSAGAIIDLTLESLNERTYPLANKGLGFPPVRAMSSFGVSQLGQTPRVCDVPIRVLPAHRLSSNPGSEFYNVYLSRPFALIYESITKNELTQLQSGPPREILWSGHFLRASLDPGLLNNPVLAPFISVVDLAEKVNRPGASALAQSLPGDYIMGPNPPPPQGAAMLPGTFGVVAAQNGEFRTEFMDLSIPGRRFPIELIRHIGGQDLYDGPFGRGWDFRFDERLIELKGALLPPGASYPLVIRGGPGDEIGKSRDVLLCLGDGRTLLFRFHGETPPPEFSADPLAIDLGWIDNANGFYLPIPGVFDMLVRFPTGQFARLTPEGYQFWYNAEGRLEKMHDKYPKNEIRFARNERGELSRVTDTSVTSDRFIQFGYYRNPNDPLKNPQLDEDAPSPFVAGKIYRAVDYSGREIIYTYDDCGRLINVKGPNISHNGPGGFLGKPEITYFYADGVAANGIIGVTAGTANGAPLLATTPDLSNPQAPVVTGGTGAGGSVSVSLGHQNTAQAIAQGGASTAVSLPVGSQTTTLDKHGLPDVATFSAGGETVAVDQDHNDQGLLTKVTYPEGNSIEYFYQDNAPTLRSRGNLIRIVQTGGPRGGGTLTAEFPVNDFKYNTPSGAGLDFNGNTITFSPAPDRRDLGSVAFGSDGSYSYTYNEYGQVLSMAAPNGVVTTYTYDNDGFRKTITRGAVTHDFAYAGMDGKRGFPTTITPPNGSALQISYTERGQAVTLTRGSGYLEHNSYNQNSRLIRTSRSLGDGAPAVTRMEYHQSGFLESMTFEQVETDSGHQDLTFTYLPDASFRVTQITHPGGEIQTFQNFTAHGAPRKMTLGSYSEDYSYDQNGNITAATGAGGGQNIYAYDGHNRLLSITSPMGERFIRTYFGNGTLETFTVLDATGNRNERVEYTRDALGRATLIKRLGTAASRNETWTYAGLTITRQVSGGDTTTFTFLPSGLPATVADSMRALSYTYDGTAVSSVTSSEGISYITDLKPINSLGFSEGLADNLGAVASYTVRHDGKITALRNALGDETRLPKSRMGETVAWQKPNGVELSFEYETTRKVKRIQDRSFRGSAVVYNTSQEVDSLTHRDGSISGYTYQNGAVKSISIPGGSITYTLDAQGRALGASIAFDGDVRNETFTYDALDRITFATYPVGSSTYVVDPLGPVSEATIVVDAASYTIGYDLRGDGFHTKIIYPSGPVDTPRDNAGRLTAVTPASGAVIVNRTYAAANIVGAESLGGVIQKQIDYDARKRPERIAYLGPGGAPLAEARYVYDAVNHHVARQYVHRAGRTDLFEYDSGYRLTKAHLGARPAGNFSQSARSFSGFSSSFPLRPGFFAREYFYDGGGLDFLNTVVTQNPDNLPIFEFAPSHFNPDSLLKDPLGHLTVPEVWIPDAALPARGSVMQVTLDYDGKGNLRHMIRPDLVQIDLQYNEKGLAVLREVTNPGQIPTIRHHVYEGYRLIEEHDPGSSPSLKAAYYYSDDDVPVAGDIRDSQGVLRRYYFLTDALGSVMALADATGTVVERYHYDAFGQATIEARDAEKPRVKRILSDVGGSLLVEFSERILPPLTVNAGPGLATSLGQLNGTLVLEYLDNGVLRQDQGALVYEETLAGFDFGTVIRFLPQFPIPPQVTLKVTAQRLADEWGNVNDAESLQFNYQASVGLVLLDTEAPPTGPETLARSSVGSPFLFQGQYYDYDAGLYYLRARHYNPYTGLFLQRDPLGYEDGPNLYAGFANNPVNNRDPFGLSIGRFAKAGRSAKRVRGTPEAVIRDKAQLRAMAQQGRPGNEVIDVVHNVANQDIGEVLGLNPGVQAVPDEAIQIEAVLQAGGRNVDFIGQGGNWFIFRDVQTGHGLRVRRGANLSDADFESTVRGHHIWDEVGLMRFYGAHRRGEFPLANGQVLDRDVMEIELFRGFRDKELVVDSDGFNGSVNGMQALSRRRQKRADKMNAYHRSLERIATQELDPGGQNFGLDRLNIFGEAVDQYGSDWRGNVRFPDPPMLNADEFHALLNAIQQLPSPFRRAR